MVSENKSVQASINQSLDPDFLKHEMKNGVFDLKLVLGYIGSQMLQFCAPLRDSEIRLLATKEDYAQVIVEMVDIMESMKLDLSNYKLQALRPHLIRQAVDYERSKFDSAILSNSIKLERTESWIKISADLLKRIANERNPEGIIRNEPTFKFDDVINHAFLSLFFSEHGASAANIPETLLIDTERIFKIQNDLQKIAILSTLIMLSKNSVPALRQNDQTSVELMDKLKLLLDKTDTDIDVIAKAIVEVSNRALEKKAEITAKLSQLTSNPTGPCYSCLSNEDIELIRGLVVKTVNHRDPLLNLLTRRIQTVVRLHLEKNLFEPSSVKKHGIDPMLANDLETVSNRIVSLVRHNKQVHAKHYNHLLERLV